MPQEQQQNPFAEFETFKEPTPHDTTPAPTPEAMSGNPYREYQSVMPGPPPQPEQTWSEWAKSQIPSTESLMVATGAGAGGAIGFGGGTILGTPIAGPGGAAVGGGFGGSIMESVYQLGQWYARQHPQSRILNTLFPPGEHAALEPTFSERMYRQGKAMQEGALQEYIGAKLTPTTGSLQESAARSATRAIGARSGEEIGRTRIALDTLIRELPRARNATELTQNLKTFLDKDGTRLNNLYNSLAPNTMIPGSSQRIVNGLVRLRDRYLVYDPATSSYRAAQGAENIVQDYTNKINYFLGGDKNVETLRTQRQVWDDMVNWWRKDIARQPQAEQVTEETANLVRHEINTAYPEIGAQNARVSGWMDLHQIAKASENVSWLGPSHTPASVLGGVMEMLTGRMPPAFAIGHTAQYLSGPFLTAWRLGSTDFKLRWADRMARGDIQGAIRLTQDLLGATAQDIMEERPGFIETRKDVLERLGKSPTAPMATVSQAPSTTGSASARIVPPPTGRASTPVELRERAAPPAAPAPAPAPAQPAATFKYGRSRPNAPSGGPPRQLTKQRREQLEKPIEVYNKNGVWGILSVGAFDPTKYSLVRENDEQYLPPEGTVLPDDFKAYGAENQPVSGGKTK